jgi:hypothetical protein
MAGDLTAILRRDLRGGENVVNASALGPLVQRWVHDPVERTSAVEILRAVYGHIPSPAHPDLLAQGLENALRRGDILLLRPRPARLFDSGGGSGEQMAAAPAPPPPGKEKNAEKTWVQFELVDENGEPVRDRIRYRLELPDGSVREGYLDGDGSVRVSNIDPGSCRIAFPDIDAREWKAA